MMLGLILTKGTVMPCVCFTIEVILGCFSTFLKNCSKYPAVANPALKLNLGFIGVNKSSENGGIGRCVLLGLGSRGAR